MQMSEVKQGTGVSCENACSQTTSQRAFLLENDEKIKQNLKVELNKPILTISAGAKVIFQSLGCIERLCFLLLRQASKKI